MNLVYLPNFTFVNRFSVFFSEEFHFWEFSTKRPFKKKLMLPYYFNLFFVDNVDNFVDNLIFGLFSRFSDVDNF